MGGGRGGALSGMGWFQNFKITKMLQTILPFLIPLQKQKSHHSTVDYPTCICCYPGQTCEVASRLLQMMPLLCDGDKRFMYSESQTKNR